MDPIHRFEAEKIKNIKKMGKDSHLKHLALRFIRDSVQYKYSYNFTWLGRPIIQIPQDIIAMQEIVWKVKPDLIIETGIAHDGSLIFYASMLELLGRGRVIGIDIEIRKHNRKEIEKHPMFKRITMIEADSVSSEALTKVRRIAKKYRKILVCLDSYHSHDHVLKELNLYSQLVSIGSYIVVFDTIVEYMPKGFFNRPWDKGNNPATAVKAFLKENKNFIVDREIENKLVITANPGGFLRRIR